MGLAIMQNTRAVTILIALAILLAKLRPICATNQEATLYGDDEKTLTLSGRNSPDLRAQGFDNLATAAQVQGMWIFYDSYNYHGAFKIITNTYTSFDNNLKAKVSSMRLVGAADNYLENTITLYEGINFQGNEVFAAKDLTVQYSASSLIITGSKPWTLYFDEHSVCADPNIVYDTNEIGIPNNRIHSVSLGCSK